MRKRSRIAIIAAIAGGLALSLFLPTALRAQAALDSRVSITLEKASPSAAFGGLAEMAGFKLVVDPAVRGPVTVRVENVRLRTLLDVVCESIGCRWQLVAGNPSELRIKPLPGGNGQPAAAAHRDAIDIRVTNADVAGLLRTFAMLGDYELDLSPEVTGKVSLEIENTPYDEALDRVCREAGCEWKVLPGDPQKLRITPAKKR